MDGDGLLIRLRDITFRYGPGRPVLEELDFDLGRNDRIGLGGANGSGKTTLLHLLVGLLQPQHGEVEIFGKPRRAEKDFFEVRTRVGLLFQDPEDQLFCPTVAEDVAFGPLNLGWSREEVHAAVRETLADLGLQGFGERVTYRLSFGEKKLVSLATVLAMRPEVLLLDEPASGLDPEHAERLVGILDRLDLPILVVGHDETFLQRVTSSRKLLSGGRIHPANDPHVPGREGR